MAELDESTAVAEREPLMQPCSAAGREKQWVGTTSRAPVLEGVIIFRNQVAENFGDIDCKSLHLGPEIDASHTQLTATLSCMYR